MSAGLAMDYDILDDKADFHVVNAASLNIVNLAPENDDNYCPVVPNFPNITSNEGNIAGLGGFSSIEIVILDDPPTILRIKRILIRINSISESSSGSDISEDAAEYYKNLPPGQYYLYQLEVVINDQINQSSHLLFLNENPPDGINDSTFGKLEFYSTRNCEPEPIPVVNKVPYYVTAGGLLLVGAAIVYFTSNTASF